MMTGDVMWARVRVCSHCTRTDCEGDEADDAHNVLPKDVPHGSASSIKSPLLTV